MAFSIEQDIAVVSLTAVVAGLVVVFQFEIIRLLDCRRPNRKSV